MTFMPLTLLYKTLVRILRWGVRAFETPHPPTPNPFKNVRSEPNAMDTDLKVERPAMDCTWHGHVTTPSPLLFEARSAPVIKGW